MVYLNCSKMNYLRAVSNMEPNNLAVFFDILGKAQKQYTKYLEPVCKRWELTSNELDVLLFLHNNPQFDRAADIVDRRGIAKSHVSLSVKDLEGRGLLIRHYAPADRRTAHLELTEQARAIAGEGCAAQRRFFSALYAGVTEAEFALWRGITQKVCGNLENLEKTE